MNVRADIFGIDPVWECFGRADVFGVAPGKHTSAPQIADCRAPEPLAFAMPMPSSACLQQSNPLFQSAALHGVST